MKNDENKAFVIAEIGVNHNNDMSIAKKLIYEAKKAGADAVKFQTFTGNELATIQTPKAPYQRLRDSSSSHQQMLSLLELTKENHYVLKDYCDKINIIFMSTAYTISDAKFLVNMKINRIKIASADIVDLQMLQYLVSLNYPVVLSTGMANEEEINRAIQLFENSENKPWLLHCISEYPTALASANLKRIDILKKTYSRLIIGYSDHTIGYHCANIAYGLGARVFEKHFTFDKQAAGPDHAASSDIPEFTEYISSIRQCELAFGSGSFQKTLNEESMFLTSRKSLHYQDNFRKDHVIEESDLRLIRPGHGLFWSNLGQILGKKLIQDVAKNEIVLESHFN